MNSADAGVVRRIAFSSGAGLLGAILCAAAALGCGAGRASAPPDFYLGGIQVNEPDMGAWHRALRDSGFNTVSLTVYARQREWNGDLLEFDPPGRAGGTLDEIRAAKRAGLHVILILRVALEHALPENRFLWHGLIQPADTDTLTRWFESYGRFVTSWAEVAQRENVDVLGIGSELSSLTSTVPLKELPALEEYYLNEEKLARERARMLAARGEVDRRHLLGGWGETFGSLPEFLEQRTAAQARWAAEVTRNGDLAYVNLRRRRLEREWRELIAGARGIYQGQLTYAANFDQFEQVAFWDALDVIGINAYFPLRNDFDPDEGPAAMEAELEASWSRILARIQRLRVDLGLPTRPVIFTELGYTSHAGATVQPWAGGGVAVLGDTEARSGRLVAWTEQPPRPEERTAAVRALRNALGRYPGLLRGLLWWKLSTIPAHREIEPFVLIIGEGRTDPVLGELQRLAAAF